MSDLALLGAYALTIIVGTLTALVASGIAGALLLAPLDRRVLGFMVGFWFGPIGWVIAWAMRDNGLRERAARDEHHRRASVDRPTAAAIASGQPWR